MFNNSRTLLAKGGAALTKTMKISSKLQASWFFATDLPKSKPQDPHYKPLNSPKKFLPFSKSDSNRIEKLYQAKQSNKIIEDADISPKVLVNEDFLFEADLDSMEISPTYWDGPIYEIRRGIWFDTTGRPLSASLTHELETQYETLHFNSVGLIAENTKDIFNLSGDHPEGSITMFLDENSAFILKDISGGMLQLKLLRSAIGQSVLPNSTKVIRGYSNLPQKSDTIKKLQDTTEDNSIETATNKLSKIGEVIGWQLSDIFNLNQQEKQNNVDAKSNIKYKEEDILKSEMENDYDNSNSESTNGIPNQRNVKHLVLCIHGIGQTLGKQYQYVNFAHTINLLRINMKNIYKNSPELKDMNNKLGNSDWKTNCNVQVLPIDWRHDINFNTEAIDTAGLNPGLPSLTDISIRGIIPVRKLIGDVGIDILLYDDPFYKEEILSNTISKLNKVFNKFKEKNPSFDGIVHIIGHSLGSVIAFDILSNPGKYMLDFKVEKLFCIGSPVGLYKLVQQTLIEEPQPELSPNSKLQRPKVEDLYNIYHMNDPIAYRMEPLIDKNLSHYEEVHIPHLTANSISNKILAIGTSLLKDLPTQDNNKSQTKVKVQLPKDTLDKILKMNSSGRVDYALTPNLLEMDVISALISHVSYFEDIDIAGFLLTEILKNKPNLNEIQAIKLKKNSD